jgi:hypothetical protein
MPGACTFNGTPASAGYPSDCWKGRHFDGNDVAFGDGHAKWIKSQEMVNEYNKTGNGAWSPDND